ncbi:LD-carboxypeptidase [Myxococcota bacterium]|nr:LD-carboxypeptidase [Myxococcota bacterium]
MLRNRGFRIVHRDDVFDRQGYLAGSDERRTLELMELLTSPAVDAVLCARGGYGCDRILHGLDAESVRAAAKPVVGYSDATALLLWLRRCAGVASIHGPMLDRGSDADPTVWAELVNGLLGALPLPYRISGESVVGGEAKGRLTGGSLSLLSSSLGSIWEPDTRGALLMIEDVGERPYRVERMLRQLVAAGKLSSVAGIGVGAFTSCRDDRYPTPTVAAVIREVLEPLGVPLVMGLPFGHIRENRAWPLGVRATIDGDAGVLCIDEQWVSHV